MILFFMPIFVATLLFIIGTMIGSFLSVIIIRSIRDEQWHSGRSKCDHCHKIIPWYDNIPLFSYLWLKGKCRFCKKPISLIHPVVELMTGLLFAWWYLGGFLFFRLAQEPFSVLQPAFWLIVGVLLMILFFTDLVYYLLPDEVVAILFGLTVIYRFALIKAGIMRVEDINATIISTAVIGIFFLLLWFGTKKKGLGFGDVKLIIPLSLLLGWPGNLVGVMLGFMLGAVVGTLMIALRKKTLKNQVPFGPFLITGTIISLIFGDQIVAWYLKFLI